MTREFDDETLMAFADGELDDERAADIEAALALDDSLAERMAAFIDSRLLVSAAFKPLIDEPVPTALTASVAQAAAAAIDQAPAEASVIAFRSRPGSASPAPRRWAMPLAASIAVIAAGLGGFLAGQANRHDEADTTSPRIAALQTEASGADIALAETGETLHLVASFRDQQGHLCREYEVTTIALQRTEIACHGASGWVTRLALSNPATDGYMPASAQETLDTFLAAMGAGAPLSAEDEQTALSELE
ncbi:hypothetical protein [Rhizobium sp. CECT 9324]|uniref:anti-sigma factor family protein n=1 Tax=Rhizobium sp. CECT 9324 TaxID=2845820 RepID=UPI001E5D07B8|nr:hypothetical protein [Rhizobium sp. CECT 9324]CAH0338607.1 hypothetical protein RHI9324_00229 [Rhizobium sp. CECT 9324]